MDENRIASVKSMNEWQLELYCNLLPLAYDVYKAQNNNMVCGSGAESLRNKMYLAIVNNI